MKGIIISLFWFSTVAILLNNIEKLLYATDNTSFICQNSILAEHLKKSRKQIIL